MTGKPKKGTYSKDRKSKTTLIIITIVLICAIGGVVIGLGVFYVGQQLSPLEEPTTHDYTTIVVKDWTSGEDISDFCEVKILVPKESDSIEDFEDITYLSKFEKEVSNDAEDIEVDLSAHRYFWVVVNPDNEIVYSTDYHLRSENGDYEIYAYHLSSDVNFNILNRDTMDAITVGNLSLAGNYTFVASVPDYTTTDIHAGSGGWDIDQDDLDEFDATEMREINDEKFWRCQAPKYDPSEDTAKRYDDPLERITEAFAFELTFNVSISKVDGNSAQVNCTLVDFYKDYPIEIVISGTKIYFIFTEPISFKDSDYSFESEISTASGIGLNNATSVRIKVPKDEDALGTVTVLSGIAA